MQSVMHDQGGQTQASPQHLASQMQQHLQSIVMQSQLSGQVFLQAGQGVFKAPQAMPYVVGQVTPGNLGIVKGISMVKPEGQGKSTSLAH